MAAVCLMKAEDTFAVAFQRAEDKGGCKTVGDAQEVEQTQVDVFVDGIVLALDTASPPKCESARFKTTGNLAVAFLNCEASAVVRGKPVADKCFASAATRFENAFAKADTKWCENPPVVDQAAVEERVAVFINHETLWLTTGGKVVFITGETHNGNLGGLAGADAVCQNDADLEYLPGTYKAWLSDSTTSAASRLTHAIGPYLLAGRGASGVKVADNWTDLTDGTLDNAINEDQNPGQDTKRHFVWTGTNADGSSTFANCEN